MSLHSMSLHPLSASSATPSTEQLPGLQVQREGAVATITLSNPPAHTWTLQSLNALRDLMRAFDRDPAMRAVVISGAGDKFFSAGADLKSFEGGDPIMATRMACAFGEAFEALSAFRGITIAAINGYAMGGGLECALACDLRIAVPRAVMALPEAAVGLLPCAGGTQWLPRLIGESRAKRMILLGERMDAPTALQTGLIDRIAEPEALLTAAREWTTAALRQAPASSRACKALIQGARTLAPQLCLPAEREAFLGLFATDEPAEGVAGFLGKRPPAWAPPA